jgi:hypothetical protein
MKIENQKPSFRSFTLGDLVKKTSSKIAPPV